MRVTDLQLKSNFLLQYNKNKSALTEVQNQLATQSKINKPSDSPADIAAVLRFRNQLKEVESFQSNIDTSITQVNTAINAMSNTYDVVESLKEQLRPLLNSEFPDVLYNSLPKLIDGAIDSILVASNTQFDGKYIFAGNDYSQKPFQLNPSTNQYEVKSASLEEKQLVEIGKNIFVDINNNGADLFNSVFKYSGNMNTAAALGFATTQTETIFGADGAEYNFSSTMTKTADNTFSYSYALTDTNGVAVPDGSGTSELIFDSSTGKLSSIGGGDPKGFAVTVPANKVNFRVDLTNITQSTGGFNMSAGLNTEADILNVLKSMRDKLLAREKPTTNQFVVLDSFTKTNLNEQSRAGDIYNRLEDAESVLNSSELLAKELISKKNDVDVAKASIELETNQYALDMLYKISARLLPQSLLNFL